MSERDVRPDNFQCIIDHGEESVPDDFRREAIEWASDTITTLREQLAEAKAGNARLREELGWYGEQARLARLIHSGGDAGRHALSGDGGKRARQALADTEGSK